MRQLKIIKQVTNRETISLDKYLHDISKVSLVTAEEEAELAQLIRAGDKDALEKLKNKLPKSMGPAIILDPPRSGLKNIQELVEKLNPSYIFMINCEVSSAIRDIKSLKTEFKILDVTILDLFPGTRHFETVSTLCFC